LCAAENIWAQKLNDSSYAAVRNEYVIDKTEKLVVSLFNRNPNNGIEFNGASKVKLFPNDPNSIGIRFQHKWLGIGIGYSPRQAQLANRGNTSSLDLHLFCYGKKLNIDAYFMQYSGYYIENVKLPDAKTKEFKYHLLPELQTTNIGAGGFYLFNHKKFSLRSNFLFNEIQKRSAGSFVIKSSVNFFRIHNPVHIIPDEIVGASATERLRAGDFYSFSFLPGYYHSFVWRKKFYFTLGTSVGPMLQLQDVTLEDAKQFKRTQLAARGSSRAALGYNSNKFFMGIVAYNDIYNYNLGKELRLNFVISEARVLIGYRFEVPRFFQPVSNQMNRLPIKYR